MPGTYYEQTVCAYVLEWMLICIYAHKRAFVVKVYCSYLNTISVCVCVCLWV